MPPLRRLPSPRRPLPPPVRSIRLGRVRLSPPRDARTPALAQVPFVRWDQFRRQARFKQGEHITIIGTTGSGKTVLARELLKPRDFVAVLGTKNNDDELYKPFEDLGYEMVGVGDFDAQPERDESRVIFRPRITSSGTKGRTKQREAFEEMLDEVWQAGGWTLYADEIWTLAVHLHLAVNFEQFWTAGRSDNLTVVASTQEPVYIPRLAFTAATHLFLFQNNDEQRIKRISEMSAGNGRLVRELLPELPPHEFLYIRTHPPRLLLTSKVILGT